MNLVFIRHGEARDIDGLCIGQTDVPLSPSGAAAIRALATAWHRAGAASVAGVPVRIVTSDLQRAADSARILAEPWELHVERDARLREMHFGEWEGRSWRDIEAQDGERLQSWMEHWVDAKPPGGERLNDLSHRASTWLAELSPADSSSTIVVVSHAGWIRAALSHLLALPLSGIFDLPVDLSHATLVRLTHSSAQLIASNVSVIP